MLHLRYIRKDKLNTMKCITVRSIKFCTMEWNGVQRAFRLLKVVKCNSIRYRWCVAGTPKWINVCYVYAMTKIDAIQYFSLFLTHSLTFILFLFFSAVHIDDANSSCHRDDGTNMVRLPAIAVHNIFRLGKFRMQPFISVCNSYITQT